MSIQINWYIQPLSHDFDTSQRISYLAKEKGCHVITESYPGFGVYFGDLVKGLDGPVLFLGAINTLRAAQRGLRYDSYDLIEWCDWQALRCTNFFSKWSGMMLSRNISFLPLNELIRMGNTGLLWNNFAHKGKIFIKPDTNNKVFNGEIVHQKNFDCWKSMIEIEKPDATLLCLVATPEDIEAEYRLVIANEKVIAASSYRKDGALHFEEGCPEAAIKLAERAAAIWSPHPIFVLDVAFSDGVATIIECGSVNVAGFYKCNLEPIVDAFMRIGEEDWYSAGP